MGIKKKEGATRNRRKEFRDVLIWGGPPPANSEAAAAAETLRVPSVGSTSA